MNNAVVGMGSKTINNKIETERTIDYRILKTKKKEFMLYVSLRQIFTPVKGLKGPATTAFQPHYPRHASLDCEAVQGVPGACEAEAISKGERRCLYPRRG